MTQRALAVHRIHVTDVTPSPELPLARPTFPVFGFLIVHPNGPILVDTGVGTDSSLIEQLYSPVHHDLDDALARHHTRVDDVRIVITSHLHFDHCGQNRRFGAARVLVQAAECEAAREALYTIPEWAFPPELHLVEIDGDHEVAAGVRIVATPGHTAGHQSVVVDSVAGDRTIICAQASWDTNSFAAGVLGDDGWSQEAGATSLRRLRDLRPDRVLLSHCAHEWRPEPATSP